MSSKKLVLLVDDSEDFRSIVEVTLKRHADVHVLSASTVEEGLALFRENRERLDAILLDGSIEPGSKELDTLPILHEIMATRFSGPVLAISGSARLRRIMLEHGATKSVDKLRLGSEIPSLF